MPISIFIIITSIITIIIIITNIIIITIIIIITTTIIIISSIIITIIITITIYGLWSDTITFTNTMVTSDTLRFVKCGYAGSHFPAHIFPSMVHSIALNIPVQ